MKVYGSMTVKSIATADLRVNEGLNAQTLLNDATLTLFSKKNQYYYVQQDRTVSLPDATTLPTGWTIAAYSNRNSTGNIYVKDAMGGVQYKLKPQKSVSIILLDKNSVAGTWKVIESGAGGGGVGDRNVVIISPRELFTVSGSTVTLNPFVASVSNGFDPEGTAIEEVIEFTGTSTLTTPTTFPHTTYVYLAFNGTILQESSKQDGGDTFPAAPLTGSIFYNKQLRKNFKYVGNAFTEYPCVALGAVVWTASSPVQVTVYPYNSWWWNTQDLTPLISYKQTFVKPAITTQVVLNTPCFYKNSLMVNVGNTLLLSTTYDLAADGVTLSFINAIEPDMPIEVSWFTPVSAIAVETTGANLSLSNLDAVGAQKILPVGGAVGDVISRSASGAVWSPRVAGADVHLFNVTSVAPESAAASKVDLSAQAQSTTAALALKANADLSNIASTVDYVVQSATNADGSWYRQYKSGWLEQGGLLRTSGEIRCTFLKPFVDTNYTLLKTIFGRSGAGQGVNVSFVCLVVGVWDLTSTSFVTTGVMEFGCSGARWMACGQGA